MSCEGGFKVGDWVEKYTGEYRARGQVRAVFTVSDGGNLRYVVRHYVEHDGSYFCHIYNEHQLRPIQQEPPRLVDTICPNCGCIIG